LPQGCSGRPQQAEHAGDISTSLRGVRRVGHYVSE
jgi:hypothetical protein